MLYVAYLPGPDVSPPGLVYGPFQTEARARDIASILAPDPEEGCVAVMKPAQDYHWRLLQEKESVDA